MSESNPILNNAYDEPQRHYATNQAGELDYERVIAGRRVFSGTLSIIPVPQRGQRELLELHMQRAQYESLLVNQLRTEVGKWREEGYAKTTGVTRELLRFWFANPDRDHIHQLFFAQREAIETAVWLTKAASTYNAGQHMLRRLSDHRVSAREEDNLPRIAFKMATGTGKTVVMAALILYHFYNRREYRNDKRFADYFLVVAPGITIRDRLGVLRVDSGSTYEAEDYYTQRNLVPQAWPEHLPQINARIVITNFHSFEQKTLQGNRRSPFDGKRAADGQKTEARESEGQMVRRVMQRFRAGGRLLVLNDDRDEFAAWRKGLSDLAKAGAKKKAERLLKIELDDDAFDRLYGHRGVGRIRRGEGVYVA